MTRFAEESELPIATIKEIAKANLKSDWLRRWWCKKYGKSQKSDEFLRYTYEELLTEYYEDVHEEEAKRLDSGSIIKEQAADGSTYYVTGDPLIDKWERMIADGQEDEIDLEEGMSDDELAYEEWKEAKIQQRLIQDGIEVPGMIPPPDFEEIHG